MANFTIENNTEYFSKLIEKEDKGKIWIYIQYKLLMTMKTIKSLINRHLKLKQKLFDTLCQKLLNITLIWNLTEYSIYVIIKM